MRTHPLAPNDQLSNAALQGEGLDNQYAVLFERTGLGKVEVDLQTGRMVQANAQFCAMTGYSADELRKLTVHDITHPSDLAQGEQGRERMLCGQSDAQNVEKRYLRKDGSTLWAMLNAVLIRDALGQPVKALGVVQDITARKLGEWFERDRAEILEMVVRNGPPDEAMTRIGAAIDRQIAGAKTAIFLLEEGDMRVLGSGVSSAWRHALREHAVRLAHQLATQAWENPLPWPGRAEGAICGVSSPRKDECWSDLTKAAAEARIECCWTVPIASSDGGMLGLVTAFFPEERAATEAEFGSLEAGVKLAAMCIEHQRTTRQMVYLVQHDALTGLANRLLLEDRMDQALALAERNRRYVAVLAMDIDRFKTINDTYGHDAGDHLLQLFAYRMSSRLRKTDTLARIGGDEFLLVLPDLGSREQASATARKLQDALLQPFEIAGRKLQVTVSIGIAMSPKHGRSGAELEKRADGALYRVKGASRNGVEFVS